jgi:putative CocE/NonD family hydrolase
MRRTTRLIGSAALFLTLASSALAAVPAQADEPDPAPPSHGLPSGWKARGEDYPSTVTQTDLQIPMSDGVVLRGDLVLPAEANGVAIPGKFPTIVTITAYNKTFLAGSGLGGAGASYLVQRGYAQLTVDARGTGSSPGEWAAFSAREDKDAGEIVTWAHNQPWSTGNVGMSGPSYMGISQLFAAENGAEGLKAIFPQVPAADVYRDIVSAGGAIDSGFMPLWLGLVSGTGLAPTVFQSDPQAAGESLIDHLMGFFGFTATAIPGALTGGEQAYDGTFYTERSPITNIDKVRVPAFFISGEYDLFQRGTPLDFEALQRNGVPTKLIIGPWNHLEGSSGADIGLAGYGSLSELQLRWFDHYVRGVADPALDTDIPPMTYYEQGTGAWRTSKKWIGDQLQATTFRLSGSATTASATGALTTGTPSAGSADVYPLPVAGLCSRSTTQWTAGISGTLPLENPCDTDNTWNDNLGVVFRTAPLANPMAIQGPINAHLFVSTTGTDGMLSVAIEDEAPDGTVSRLTGGWQVLSHRALNAAKSRYLDGQLIQPWHPFTAAAQAPMSGIKPIDVEIFPTGAKLLASHRLRISIQAADTPHALPTLSTLLGTGVITIHTGPGYPSSLTLPTVRPARVSTVTTAKLATGTTKVGKANPVAVTVTGGSTPGGKVGVYVAGVLVRTATLSSGKATVALPARAQAGRWPVVVEYLGDAYHLPSKRTAYWTTVR